MILNILGREILQVLLESNFVKRHIYSSRYVAYTCVEFYQGLLVYSLFFFLHVINKSHCLNGMFELHLPHLTCGVKQVPHPPPPQFYCDLINSK